MFLAITHPTICAIVTETGTTAVVGIAAIPGLLKAIDVIVDVIIIALLPLALFLHLYLRLRYPCITIAELDNTEHILDDVFDSAARDDYLLTFELDDIERARLRSKTRASEIRSQSAHASTLTWIKRLGSEVKIMSDLVEWYGRVEELRREILATTTINKPFETTDDTGTGMKEGSRLGLGCWSWQDVPKLHSDFSESTSAGPCRVPDPDDEKSGLRGEKANRTVFKHGRDYIFNQHFATHTDAAGFNDTSLIVEPLY
ncbi:40S ribosomal protein S6 [Paramarasmius palmivorus]|uniref:40S ribosomal protein S6 n=1 Tax=Paramarasmius palmivorus TaxID=297713 RepID=A0AAW0AX06_9AGAR